MRLRSSFKVAAYFVLTAAIAVTTALLVKYGEGFRYDFRTKTLAKTGLVWIDSTPAGAVVVINGEQHKKRTPLRLDSLLPGSYHIRLKKEGFSEWENTAHVIEGKVTWALYPLLFPADSKEELFIPSGDAITALYPPPARTNRRFVFSTAQGLFVLDTKTKEQKTLLALLPGERITEVTWSEKADKLLVVRKTESDQKASQHYVINPADPKDSIVLETLFPHSFDRLSFNPNDSNELFWVSTQGDLFRIHHGNKSISKILATNTHGFTVFKDALFIVTETESGLVLLKTDFNGENKKELIPALKKGPYKLAVATINNVLTIFALNTETKTLLKLAGEKTERFFGDEVVNILLSADRQFLYIETKTGAKTLDLEQETFSDLPFRPRKLTWFPDSRHYMFTEGSELFLADFDGANKRSIGQAALESGFGFSSSCYCFLYLKTPERTEPPAHGLFSYSLKKSYQ